MSKIVVFGAAGKAGRRIVAEAVSRGHSVVAVARGEQQDLDDLDGVTVVTGDGTCCRSSSAAGVLVMSRAPRPWVTKRRFGDATKPARLVCP